MALREGRFLLAAHDKLASGTIRHSISDISVTFRENGQPNPTKDNDLQLSFVLHHQFRAYKINKDPKEKQQKAIPACIIAKIAKKNLTSLQCAISQLPTLAFFFAMCSCEYVKVQQHETQRTEILRVRNLRFFKTVDSSATTTHLSSTPTASTSPSKCRKGQKNDATTLMLSRNVTLCPV